MGADDRSEREGRCPDRGYCHGSGFAVGTPPCEPNACRRVKTAGPLSGVFPGDRWPAELRSNLEGATTTGDPAAYANTPGEFAARWNSWDEDMRTTFLRFVQHAASAAQTCTMLHDGRRYVPTYGD